MSKSRTVDECVMENPTPASQVVWVVDCYAVMSGWQVVWLGRLNTKFIVRGNGLDDAAGDSCGPADDAR